VVRLYGSLDDAQVPRVEQQRSDVASGEHAEQGDDPAAVRARRQDAARYSLYESKPDLLAEQRLQQLITLTERGVPGPSYGELMDLYLRAHPFRSFRKLRSGASFNGYLTWLEIKIMAHLSGDQRRKLERRVKLEETIATLMNTGGTRKKPHRGQA
jgi:hypothetical protein